MKYKRDAVNLLILITVATGIGVYLIATTVLISKDGTAYIDRAQRFASDHVDVIMAHPPGYSLLIFLVHRFVLLFTGSSSVFIWTCSAQSTTLLCRLLALVPLYLIGRTLFDARTSFWGILILVILPYPAEFGSDVLRGWPHVLFLATGFLLLLLGAMRMKWWIFGAAGFVAGLGHFVRPECAQLVIYGLLWLLTRLLLPKRYPDRSRIVFALFILLIGFLIPVVPYRKMRGNVLPRDLNELLGSSFESGSDNTASRETVGQHNHSRTTALRAGTMTKAVAELVERLSDVLFYFFLPPLLVGAYMHYGKRHAARDIDKFFMPVFIAFNIVMLLLLHRYYGYISRRHTLPLVSFTPFYIPLGLQTLGNWLERVMYANGHRAGENSQRWFLILMVTGVAVCLPKLLRPLGADKRGYKFAAEWLKANTSPGAIVAVPDPRISFYAEREGLVYDKDIPEGAEYIVRVVSGEDERLHAGGSVRKECWWVDDRRKAKRIVLYEVQ